MNDQVHADDAFCVRLQEARGSSIENNHFYVENVFEELDTPGEWFFDEDHGKLYFWPNTTLSGLHTHTHTYIYIYIHIKMSLYIHS